MKRVLFAVVVLLAAGLVGVQLIPMESPEAMSVSSSPSQGQRLSGSPLSGGTSWPSLLLPDQMRPGDLIPVRVQGVGGAAHLWLDSDLTQWAGSVHLVGGQGLGFIGIDPRVPPGQYTVRVGATWGETTSWETERSLTVVSTSFPVQHLTVSPSLQAVRSPDLWALDWPHFERARSHSHPEPLWEGPFVMPAEGRLSTEFGVIRYINNVESGRHNGIDIAAPTGTPVLAASRGVVTLAMELNVTGNTVIIDHGLYLFSVYYHLHTIDVTEGQLVHGSDFLGTVGSTGFSTGPHLHFGVSVAHQYVNPWLLMDHGFLPES